MVVPKEMGRAILRAGGGGNLLGKEHRCYGLVTVQIKGLLPSYVWVRLFDLLTLEH